METEISEKIQRLTRILSEEAGKSPRITVTHNSTGPMGMTGKSTSTKNYSLAPSLLPPTCLSPSTNSGRHSGTSSKRLFGVRRFPLHPHCAPVPSKSIFRESDQAAGFEDHMQCCGLSPQKRQQ